MCPRAIAFIISHVNVSGTAIGTIVRFFIIIIIIPPRTNNGSVPINTHTIAEPIIRRSIRSHKLILRRPSISIPNKDVSRSTFFSLFATIVARPNDRRILMNSHIIPKIIISLAIRGLELGFVIPSTVISIPHKDVGTSLIVLVPLRTDDDGILVYRQTRTKVSPCGIIGRYELGLLSPGRSSFVAVAGSIISRKDEHYSFVVVVTGISDNGSVTVDCHSGICVDSVYIRH
mmetsp:Transcript_4328/g.9822  ORF Transcript_4328/g.9822 Transcript_4328/m.9822 type:complete len:231 (+) Transcript_4328:129-821(+)